MKSYAGSLSSCEKGRGCLGDSYQGQTHPNQINKQELKSFDQFYGETDPITTMTSLLLFPENLQELASF